ncbi:hypothetical protein ON010_g17701 [Phytophthora cinnamomi]|nr:hypothetical protein ON010_g17701 [Phytophthora cinnamomi]
MSTSEETDPALADVFTFFDSLDSDSDSSLVDIISTDGESGLAEITSTDGESSSVSTPSVYAMAEPEPSPPYQVTTSSKARKKRKPRQPGQVPQSTKFQRQKRDQVLALRQQVLELAARLKQLQRTRRQSETTKKSVEGPRKPNAFMTVWEDLAILQCQERQRSEQTNKELKAILARQRKLGQSICKVLGKKDALEGMEWLCQLHPPPDSVEISSSPSVKIDLSDAVLAELEMTVTGLYMRTNSLFPPLEGNPIVSFSSQDKYGDPLGTYIETMTTTPMPCPLHVAADILWEGTSKLSQDPEKVPIFMRTKCHNTLSRRCKLDLHNTVRIDAVNFVRRYVHSDRIVLVSASTWFLPAEGFHFQDNIWTIVSRSPVDPQNASVVQSFCQFGAHASKISSMSREDFAPAQEYVRGTVGAKLRHIQEQHQKFLLENAMPAVGSC